MVQMLQMLVVVNSLLSTCISNDVNCPANGENEQPAGFPSTIIRRSPEDEAEVLSNLRHAVAMERSGGEIRVIREKVPNISTATSGVEHEGQSPEWIVSVGFTNYLLRDSDLKQLGRLSFLKSLNVVGPVTDDGIAFLSRLRNLRSLRVQSRLATNAACESLRKITSLRELDIRYTDISGKGIRSLSTFSELEKCVLPLDPTISGHDLRSLLNSRRLKYLAIDHCNVSDATVQQLMRLDRLEYLGLSGTKITDNSVEFLIAMPRLKAVHLDGVNMSNNAIARLRQAKPDLVILGK